MAVAPQLELVPGIGDRIHALLRQQKEPRMTQLMLAERAGISRQTLSTVLSKNQVTRPVAMAIAEVFDVPVEHLLGTLADDSPAVGASGETTTSRRTDRSLPYVVRVWMKEFELELARAGATDDEIQDARELLTSPRAQRFYVGGKPNNASEAQLLTGMQAHARFIRDQLKKAGRKFA